MMTALFGQPNGGVPLFPGHSGEAQPSAFTKDSWWPSHQDSFRAQLDPIGSHWGFTSLGAPLRFGVVVVMRARRISTSQSRPQAPMQLRHEAVPLERAVDEGPTVTRALGLRIDPKNNYLDRAVLRLNRESE